jgi:hypothetical protein
MTLADRLRRANVLTPDQMEEALTRQHKYRGYLAKHLVALNLVDPEILSSFLTASPPVPENFLELGLPEHLLFELFLKHAYFLTAITVREMSDVLKLPRTMVESMVEHLRSQKYLDVKPRDVLRPMAGHLALEISYILSDQGKVQARQFLEMNSYVGPVPVSLEDYWDWVEAQSIREIKVSPERLHEVFADYVVSDTLFEEIGPAVVSGRSLFLFGPSGNGKSVLGKAIGEAFTDAVYLPYALYVHGQIIRVFSELNHRQVTDPNDQPHDGRWVLCRRPVVVAGGEMTEKALEPQYNPVSHFYEAPHQMKANNGILIIDDFGRQRISASHLLNRWMLPLETRQDFCNLHTGQQFSLPFDQLLIFCTNLDPNTLADEAFLRRIHHKIYIGDVTPDQYLEIFRRECAKYGLNFDRKTVEHIFERHYFSRNRPFRACHPRDLLDNLLDYARFSGQAPKVTKEALDRACHNYFVKEAAVLDYDKVTPQSEK